MAYRTRAQIEASFTVENGIIKNPGRYEGEYLWAPYYDTLANEGDSEFRFPHCLHRTDETCECQAWDYFKVDTAERDNFAPYLDGINDVWLWIDSQGFLIVKTNTDEATIRREYHGIAD